MTSPRRRFLRQAVVAALSSAIPAQRSAAQPPVSRTQKVAAIQFTPVLADVAANLTRAEGMGRAAIGKGASWIVFPEFFPTGAALHPKMIEAGLPLDGPPMQMLKALATSGRAYVSGSFLVRAGADVYNTAVLACPDGSVFTHDKDFPTMVFESAYFVGGEDAAYAEQLASHGAVSAAPAAPPRPGNSLDGAFTHAGTGIGTALCWEIVRHRTARRLAGKVDILLASSGWWTADPNGAWPGLQPAQAASSWNEHRELIALAPARLAKQIGAPVVHANFTGGNAGYSTLAFDRPAQGRYLGRSQVVDATGRTVARLEEDEGVLIAELAVGRVPPLERVPAEFWLPEVTEGMRRRWASSGAMGRDFYFKAVRK